MTNDASPAVNERLARRHLSEPRRRVLETLSACGPRTTGGIAECWIDRALDGRDRYVGRLPGMVSQLLWKLEILNWVTEHEGRYAITADGSKALATTGAAGWRDCIGQLIDNRRSSPQRLGSEQAGQRPDARSSPPCR